MARVKARQPAPVDAFVQAQDPSLPLYVIFTSPKGTRRALEAARLLARDLNLRLVLLAAQVVPYPLPVDEPPVSGNLIENLLKQVAGRPNEEIEIRRYLCRNPVETIRHALRRGSLVLIGSTTRWWPGWERSLARALRRDGHQVIFVDTRLRVPARAGVMKMEPSS